MLINDTEKEKVAQTYSWLRAMSGGKLAHEQVTAGDSIIAMNGLKTFAQVIGYKLDTNVTGFRDISENGYKLIKSFEGFEPKAYQDTGGVWTIGYGTIKYPNGTRVKKGDMCTMAEAEEWLKNDCAWVDACLDKYLKNKPTQNQFDALASLVYNIGETAFSKSTMLKNLNAGDIKGAANQFDKWVYDNGKVINGLVNRRAAEKKLFLT
ncbi:lysozyme [Acinetobacter pittii]|uniref:Lysozyme n=1 Tax=Acinetobacter pittii TaxID=48296 RepID=A0AAE9S790_ACIPI|nr:lysozyme [Acinetobacter pittii]AZP29915.1 lysozyme [Acinetobacter pittii]MDP7814350.1 lysozyme [Acinetobacter pittii]USU93341.1 lysozyme [Acinetobacter pittii]